MAVAKGLPHALRNDWDAFRLRPYGQKAPSRSCIPQYACIGPARKRKRSERVGAVENELLSAAAGYEFDRRHRMELSEVRSVRVLRVRLIRSRHR